MSGRVSNSASITGPMTCTTRPTLGAPGATVAVSGAVAAMYRSPWSLIRLRLFQRRGAAHDLRDLLRDRGLAHPVVGAGERLEHVARVVGGVLHGGALGPVEPGHR